MRTSPEASQSEQYITILESGRASRYYWRDFWRHRELLMHLVWRDILVRYKQTVVGASWVIIRPLLTMIVFTVVFGRLAGLPSNGLPYSLVVFSGMLPWFFFSSALSEISNSLIGNAHLLSKIYFPRLIIPVSTLLVALVDYLVSCLLIIGVMAWNNFIPDWRILTLPLFTLFAMVTAFGLGLWAAALNVRYRDFRHIIPFVLQIGVYVSPVGYSSEIIPERWRLLYSVNPMVGVIDGFRWALLGGNDVFFWEGFVLSVALSFAMLFLGVWYFRRTEATFADVI